MSLIASMYVVPSALLDSLARLASRKQYAEFWHTLETSTEALPEFPYESHVMAAAVASLDEQGVHLPSHTDLKSARAIYHRDFGLVFCIGQDDARKSLASLDALALSEAQLRRYYESLYDEEWEEAGVAMRESIALIRQALVHLLNQGGWLMLFIH